MLPAGKQYHSKDACCEDKKTDRAAVGEGPVGRPRAARFALDLAKDVSGAIELRLRNEDPASASKRSEHLGVDDASLDPLRSEASP